MTIQRNRFPYLVFQFLAMLLLLIPVSSIQAANLLHAWSFESNLNDTSGSGNNGTISGGTETYVAGKFGSAIDLTSGQSVDAAAGTTSNLPLLASDSWSMNLWLNLDTPLSSLANLAGFGNRDTGGTPGGERRSYLAFSGTDGNDFYFWGDSDASFAPAEYSTDSAWHMYTITYDGAEIYGYKDGELINGGALGLGAVLDDSVFVGGPSFWAINWAGAADEFTIWDSSLSPAEISGLLVNNDPDIPAIPEHGLTIDRETGNITLENIGVVSSTVLGYSLRSSAGSFSPADWTSIAENYDVDNPGPNQVDPNNHWLEFTDSESNGDLSEGELDGGSGAILSGGQMIDLGDAWIQSPYEDVTAEILYEDGTIEVVTVSYTGNGGVPLTVGDLDFNGSVNELDWGLFKVGLGGSFPLLSLTEAYQVGDLNGDGANDISDFILFERQYDLENGAGAFKSMLASVPEPSSILLLAVCGVLALAKRPRQRMKKSTALAAIAFVSLFVGTQDAQAGLVGYWPMNGSADDSSGVNIDLTLVGDANFAGSALPGLGGAIATDGDGDGAVGENFVTIAGNDATVVAWVWADSLPEWASIAKNWGQTVGGQFHLGLGVGDDDFLNNFVGGADATLDTTPFSTGQWVHTAFVLDSTAMEHRLYMNGTLVNTAAYAGTLNQTPAATGFGIGAKPNNTGSDISPAAAAAGVWDGRIDEVGIYDEAFSPTEISDTYQAGLNGIQLDGTSFPHINMLVNRDTGYVALLNNSSGSVTLNSYQVSSETGSLDSAAWSSLESQDLASFPAGSGTGDGWEAGQSVDDATLVEAFLQGSSTLGVGETLLLGAAFDESGSEDAVFEYSDLSGFLASGSVIYLDSGDMNGDGSVDSADVNPFVQALVDRDAYDAAYPGVNADLVGDVNGSGTFNLGDVAAFKALFSLDAGSGSTSVPEPSSLLLLTCGLAAVLSGRRIRRQESTQCS